MGCQNAGQPSGYPGGGLRACAAKRFFNVRYFIWNLDGWLMMKGFCWTGEKVSGLIFFQQKHNNTII
jgi:hypothetical protein